MRSSYCLSREREFWKAFRSSRDSAGAPSLRFVFFLGKGVAEEREVHDSPDQLCSGLPEATSVHLAEPG